MTSVYFYCRYKDYIVIGEALKNPEADWPYRKSLHTILKYVNHPKCREIAPLLVYHFFVNNTMDIWKGKAEPINMRLSICTKNAKAENFDSPIGKKVQVNIGLFERLLHFFQIQILMLINLGFIIPQCIRVSVSACPLTARKSHTQNSLQHFHLS